MRNPDKLLIMICLLITVFVAALFVVQVKSRPHDHKTRLLSSHSKNNENLDKEVASIIASSEKKSNTAQSKTVFSKLSSAVKKVASGGLFIVKSPIKIIRLITRRKKSKNITKQESDELQTHDSSSSGKTKSDIDHKDSNDHKSKSEKVSSSTHVNDHLSIDINQLTPTQKQLIETVRSTPTFQSESLRKLGRQTGVEVNDFLIYRYFAAADWSPTYHGKPVEKAIEETIQWRSSYGIHHISHKEIRPFVEASYSYVSPVPDKFGRTVIYINQNKYISLSPALFIKYIMYNVERYVAKFYYECLK